MIEKFNSFCVGRTKFQSSGHVFSWFLGNSNIWEIVKNVENKGENSRVQVLFGHLIIEVLLLKILKDSICHDINELHYIKNCLKNLASSILILTESVRCEFQHLKNVARED